MLSLESKLLKFIVALLIGTFAFTVFLFLQFKNFLKRRSLDSWGDFVFLVKILKRE